MSKILKIYEWLMKEYGPQGWWPIRSTNGYHPGNYTFPHTDLERLEIALGAILTQNTNWSNVEKSLINLYRNGELSAEKIIRISDKELIESIRPSGYFNQKGKKLKIFAQFFCELNGKVPTREQLLNLWGIGPETADSILLYAYNYPSFVVDTYTRRIFGRLTLIKNGWDYQTIKHWFERDLPRDVSLYQEFHALIVEHAKRYYSPKNNGKNCPLLSYLNRC